MLKNKISIIVLWVIGGIAIGVFAYICCQYGFLPILNATSPPSPQSESNILSIWTICIFAVFCVMLGSIGSISAIYYFKLFRDTWSQQSELNDQTVATEILNLKSHIRFIYSIVPVVFIFLSLVGIQGYHELTQITGIVQIREAATEWSKIKNEWSDISGEWQRISNAKADKEYVDENFIKGDILETKIKNSVDLKDWARHHAHAAISEAKLLKTAELVKEVKASDDLRNWVQDTASEEAKLLKTAELVKEVKASDDLKDWARHHAHAAISEAKLLKTAELVKEVKASDDLRNWVQDTASEEAKLLKTAELVKEVKASDDLKDWARHHAHAAISEAKLLKTAELVKEVKASDDLRNWVRTQVSTPTTDNN